MTCYPKSGRRSTDSVLFLCRQSLDREAIRDLRSRYYAHVNEEKFADIAPLFTEEGKLWVRDLRELWRGQDPPLPSALRSLARPTKLKDRSPVLFFFSQIQPTSCRLASTLQ